MNKINLLGREVPFANALLHLAECLLYRDFKVVDYGIQHLTITAGQSTARYSSNHMTGLVRLLQLVQAVQSFGMDDVPIPPVFRGEQGFVRWDRLQSFQGEQKVKTALAYLGGMDFFFQNDHVFLNEAPLEKVCEAFVLFEEDRRTPMKAWLEKLTKKVRA